MKHAVPDLLLISAALQDARDAATIDVGDEGVLEIETSDERILLTIEQVDGDVIGHCPVNLSDPRSDFSGARAGWSDIRVEPILSLVIG